MPDRDSLPVIYSGRSFENTTEIKGYLLLHFTQREVDKLYALLQSLERVVTVFPDLYPKSIKNKKMHRAVLSKQLSVFYTVSKKAITIVSIMDNRMAYTRWP